MGRKRSNGGSRGVEQLPLLGEMAVAAGVASSGFLTAAEFSGFRAQYGDAAARQWHPAAARAYGMAVHLSVPVGRWTGAKCGACVCGVGACYGVLAALGEGEPEVNCPACLGAGGREEPRSYEFCHCCGRRGHNSQGDIIAKLYCPECWHNDRKRCDTRSGLCAVIGRGALAPQE